MKRFLSLSLTRMHANMVALQDALHFSRNHKKKNKKKTILNGIQKQNKFMQFTHAFRFNSSVGSSKESKKKKEKKRKGKSRRKPNHELNFTSACSGKDYRKQQQQQ